MYSEEWEDCVGKYVRAEIEENNRQIEVLRRLDQVKLDRAIEESGNRLTLDQMVSIAPRVFGVWL